MTVQVTFQRLVERVSDPGPIAFGLTEEDFGALLPYAWAGLDDDSVRDRLPKSIDINHLAYPRGKSIVIDLIPEAPPVQQVTTAVRGSIEFNFAIGMLFTRLQTQLDKALGAQLRLPARRAIRHLDLFHPILVVNKRIPTTRFERRRITGASMGWIDIMSEVTFASLERRYPGVYPQRQSLSLLDERDSHWRNPSKTRMENRT